VAQLILQESTLGTAAFQHACVGLQECIQALNVLLHPLHIGLQCCTAGLQQLCLVVHQLSDLRLRLRCGQQILRKLRRVRAHPFGLQPTLHGPQGEVAQARGLVVGTGGGIVQNDERLAVPDGLALMHEHLAHDTA